MKGPLLILLFGTIAYFVASIFLLVSTYDPKIGILVTRDELTLCRWVMTFALTMFGTFLYVLFRG